MKKSLEDHFGGKISSKLANGDIENNDPEAKELRGYIS